MVLNGPAGVGKTTVGRLLAASASNGVCIHGDDLKNFVVAREPASVANGLSYVGAAALADVYLAGGYELVVIDFIFTRAAQVERLRSSLRSTVPVFVYTLWAPLDVVQAREARRADRVRLGQRVRECWTELAPHRDELGVAVDALATPEEIVATIRRGLSPV